MKIKLFSYEIISSIIIMALGTILHFTYDWSNNNYIVGLFSSVNESVWEHLKLLFFPSLIMIIIGNLIFIKKYPYYICNKTKGLLKGLSFIIIFFYTYTGILGKNFPILDISSFFIAVLISQISAFKNKDNFSCKYKLGCILLLIIISFQFIIFTYKPLNLGIFKTK